MKLKNITYDNINNKLHITIQRDVYGDWPTGSEENDGENIVWDMSGIDNQCSFVCCNEMSSNPTKFAIKPTWDLEHKSINECLWDEKNTIWTDTNQTTYTVYDKNGDSTSKTGYKKIIENYIEVDVGSSFLDIEKDLMFVFFAILDNTKEGRPIEVFVFPYYLASAYNKLILSTIKNNFVTDCCKGLNDCLMNHLLAKYGFEYALNLMDCRTMIKYWNILHDMVNTKTSNSGCGCGR